MNTLKVALISLRDVLVREVIEKDALEGAVRLLQFLVAAGVQPVLVANKGWIMKTSNEPFQDYLQHLTGIRLPYYVAGTEFRKKEDGGAMARVAAKHGATPQESVYIGSTELDMRASRNSGILFLNAKWYSDNSKYGFEFASALDIARFIDCCCLRPKDWYWIHRSSDFQVMSIAPLAEYSRRYPQGADYSSNAKNAAKFNHGDIRFWGLLMASRLHFSGLGASVSYVAPYPGHRVDSVKPLLTNALKIAASSLSAQYLDDLLIRHTTAEKSQSLRRAGRQPTHENQLQTIHLRPDPIRTGAQAKRYKSSPLGGGKRVLIVDDICTQGNSFEAARVFIERAGSKAVGVSWLKTPGNDYNRIADLKPPISNAYSPYIPLRVGAISHSLNSEIHNDEAAAQISDAFIGYSNWTWPT